MANTTYFLDTEDAPLAIPDNRQTPFTGFVSSRKYPTGEGQGEQLADQMLPDSNCEGLSEKTLNTAGSTTYVSWMTRDSLNEYGVTTLPPKV